MTPAVRDSILDSTCFNAGEFRPFGNTTRFTVNCYHYVCALVAVLLFRCSPATVARLVISIGVWISVKRRASLWATAHVLEKLSKVVFPFVAHSDTASAVVFISRICWIETPLFSVLPRLVFRSRISCAVSVLSQCFSNLFSAITSTAKSEAAQKIRGIYDLFSPASTKTKPASSSLVALARIGCALQNSQTAETQSSKISMWHLQSIA